MIQPPTTQLSKRCNLERASQFCNMKAKISFCFNSTVSRNSKFSKYNITVSQRQADLKAPLIRLGIISDSALPF